MSCWTLQNSKLPPRQTPENLQSQKNVVRDNTALIGLKTFELPTRLIPCEGLHQTCVEGPPTCGNFRTHYKTLIALGSVATLVYLAEGCALQGEHSRSPAAADSVPCAAPNPPHRDTRATSSNAARATCFSAACP